MNLPYLAGLPPEIAILALIPGLLVIVVVAAAVRQIPTMTRLAAVTMWLQLALVISICTPQLGRTTDRSVVVYGFSIDRLAAILLVLTTLVAAASLTHAVGFFDRELDGPHAPRRQHVSQFYIYLPLFVLAMYGVLTAQNLGYLWISMEATTLLSAPLVYYHRSRTSLEATWKYLIICSVGIAFAFFGTAIIYSASQHVPGLPSGSLLLPVLQSHASQLPKGLLRLGFVFILLGYGTKAGLFPLHHWLPDAHSEAPAPASALLSGALLNCALVAIWRTRELMGAAGEGRLVEQTLLPMALATVLAASLFLVRQRDLKRMLAYSSMENVGVMATAIAFGSGSGFLLQAINHSLVKVALFLLAGNLIQMYGSKSLKSIHGALNLYPIQGVCLLAGIIAVAGTPPFGSFLSEWIVLSTAADSGHAASVALLTLGLVIAFVALAVQAGGMLFGENSRSLSELPNGRRSLVSLTLVPGILLLLSLWLGVALSPTLMELARGIVL